ncbi:NADPH:quinone reductase [Geomonas sp. Red32]|uniref:NADPH:quinone reductase n=1 Tax=Geomonas sp. Red32 TaxID=2912856 RepID=UPI00202CCC8C|nr:NADPH:quinone reductase [Geomonas sp. Red32]MCM0080925.1 NADPH:quinone reductase [Geomonas sp. Red32]
MKAIIVNRLGGPEVMRIEEVADPSPGEGEVVVRLHAVGVNPVDTYIRSGHYGDVSHPPYTPGMDGAGIVEAIGSGVKHRKPGQRVYVAWSITGTYAEKVLCREGQTHPLPENLSFSQGAGVGVPYATAYRALFQKGRAVGGENVLIHGASGGVGLAAVQFARAAGLWVIGSAGSDQGGSLVLREGAHAVVDHHREDHLAKAVEQTCGQGFDVIVEMLANQNLGRDLEVVANGGRIVVVGSRGTVEIDPRNTMAHDASIVGMALFNATEAELAGIHAAVVAGLENGTLRPVVSRELPLAEAPEAHRAIMESSTLGKIVLIP